MKRKTQEEKRETNRKKQARWRARHREEWLYRQKKLATYGQAAWQKGPSRVTDNPDVTYVACDEGGAEMEPVEGGKPLTAEEVRVEEQLSRLVARRKVMDNPVRNDPSARKESLGIEIEGF